MSGPDFVVWYVQQMIFHSYMWAGDDPILGWDCSGVLVEALKADGKLPGGSDYNSSGLISLYREVDIPRKACIVGYGVDKVTHVMLAMDGRRVIGGTGGDSATVTLEQAAKDNAFVKVRPLDYRNDRRIIVDPYFEERMATV